MSSHHHWFEPIAEHLGGAYLRYSFTKGTSQEIDSIVDWLGLKPGMRVLDIGCGPGRHANELASRGIETHGIDISQRFVDIAIATACPGATFERLDARHLRFSQQFDAAICLCQGAFGLMTTEGHDLDVLQGIARALKPGGRLALSAFNAYFAVKHEWGNSFDAATGVSHEETEVKDEQGNGTMVELWTGCYTPRELRLLVGTIGMTVDHIYSVEPGKYLPLPPSVESAEFLLIASATPFHR